jgi:hypothetical protein
MNSLRLTRHFWPSLSESTSDYYFVGKISRFFCHIDLPPGASCLASSLRDNAQVKTPCLSVFRQGRMLTAGGFFTIQRIF